MPGIANPDYSLQDPNLSKFESLEMPFGEQYHSLRIHSSLRNGLPTSDGVGDPFLDFQTYSGGTVTTRSLKYYRNSGTGENLLNVTCSLDTDSLVFSPMMSRVETDIDSSIDYGTPIEGQYAASVTSPVSSYSSASLENFLEGPRLVDRNSGVVFQTVSQGTRGVLSGLDIGLASVMYDLDYVPATPTPGESFTVSAGTSGSLPAIALTVPTPVIPPSPIFVPQSPLTLSKFSAASEKFLDDGASIVSLMSVPLMPECEECEELRRQQEEEYDYGLDGEDGFGYCRACHRQWLACQVWYQAADGGRRQYLREPFIKPGEANASNRAIMEMMGIPASPTFDDRMDTEREFLSGLVVEMRDASDSVGIARKIRKSVKRKLRISWKKAVKRFSDGGRSYESVDEIGRIQRTESYHQYSNDIFKDSARRSRRGSLWKSFQKALRLYRT